jgi:outer membrane immunogenic protein
MGFFRAGLVLTTAIGLVQSAAAADMPVKMLPVKAVPLKTAPIQSWTGVYLGATVGARWNDSNFTTSNPFPSAVAVGLATLIPPGTAPLNSAAARFGGYVGFNYQFAPTWVAGFEGYGGYANNTKTLSPIPGTPFVGSPFIITNPPVATVKENWDAGIRARLGYLVTPSTLVYATGGGAWQSVSIQSFCPSFGALFDFCSINEGTPKVSKVMGGWTVGGGVEYRLTANWFARLDYQYADYGSFSNTFFTFVGPLVVDDRYTATVKVRTHTANVGVSYMF